MVLGGRIADTIHIIDYRRIRVMGNLEKLDALKRVAQTGASLDKMTTETIFQPIRLVISGVKLFSIRLS